MPGNLSWRVAKLESKAGSGHRMYHAVQGPKHCDVRRELADLGIEVEDNDLVVIFVDPTSSGKGYPFKHLYSKAM